MVYDKLWWVPHWQTCPDTIPNDLLNYKVVEADTKEEAIEKYNKWRDWRNANFPLVPRAGECIASEIWPMDHNIIR